MKIRTVVSVALLVAAASVVSRAQTAPSLQGVWRITESVTTGANAETNRNRQPGLYMFTKEHYSVMFVRGTAARKDFGTAKDPAKLTDAEKMARYEAWDPFTANSGTYSVNGDTLTFRPLVSKSPAVMAGAPTERKFSIEGNTLTIITKSAAGQPASETTTRLTRVE